MARIGGEEFAWLLPEADGEEAYQAAERARAAIAASPVGIAGTVTTSAGVCDLAQAGTPRTCCARPTARSTGPRCTAAT